MSNLASFGSAQASSWATQRKEAMDKAKALREGKKTSLAKTGEMTMMSHNPNDKSAHSNTRGNPSKNLSHTGKYDEYENKPYNQEQRNNRTNTYNAPSKQEPQKTNLVNRGKEALGNANPYSRGNVDRGVGSMEQEYVKQKPLSQTQQPTNQNYRQVYKPNFNNEPEPQRKAPTNQQYQLKTLPQDSQENYEDYSNPMGNRQQPYKARQENTQFSTQNTTQSRVQKNQYNENAGRNQYRNEYTNPYDEPQMDKRQIGNKRDTYDQGGYGYEEKPVGRNYQASTRQQQQHYPEQQKEYNPMNYGARPSNKGYSEEIYDQPKSRVNYEQDQGRRDYGNNAINQAKPSSKQINQRNTYDNSSRNSMNTNSTNFEDDRVLNSKNRQQPIMERERPTGSESLVQCPAGCGRSFFPEVLEKHAKVCQKVFQSKRKQFDTASQRITEDVQKVQVKKPAPSSKFNKTMANNNNATINRKPENAGNISKQAKWKQESEAFRASMKVARGETLSKSEQVAMANNQQDSLVPCNYCGRRFNEKAAERHIPFCQTKQKDVKKSVPKPRKF